MNSSKISRLHVFAHLQSSWVPCGQLSLTEDGANLVASAFEYRRAYARRAGAFEIDPVSLAITGSHSVVGHLASPAYGLNSFGAIRDAAPDSWGRRVIEAKLGAPLNGLSESQYLLHAGSSRVGALDIRANASALPLVADDTWDRLADLAQAADLIEQGRDVPAHLADIFVQGAALGGARPKAAVRDEHSTAYIAKFASAGDRFNVPAIEFATMKLADKAGLRVPDVRLAHANGKSVLLVRRFDRCWKLPDDPRPQGDIRFVRGQPTSGTVEHRIPYISGLTLVGIDEMQSRHMSYASVAGSMRTYCRTLLSYDGSAELFKRMVFNIMVSNSDDHLRNLGFLWDGELRTWRLSPAFDLLPQPSVATERFQHLSVGEHGRLATLDNALSDCHAFEVSKEFACRIIADVWRVVSHWRDTFDDLGIDPQESERVKSAFRNIDDVSSAELRRMMP